METQVRTPQLVFMHPQRLIVPLFQRPYVWNQDNQWEPLWNDIVRIANRLLARPSERHHPHFLGAVVLQFMPQPTGFLPQRTIIDGQQRLTTLQLLLDALHSQLLVLDVSKSARRLEDLVANAEHFCAAPEDRFKVWPTNRDRPAFNAVMGAAPPIDYDAISYRGERMVEAHRYFAEQARQWLLADGTAGVEARGAAIETVARELLQMVVIDLAPDENAQEIFETLNARGAQLTAADLIKNFVFQKLLESGTDVEDAYERRWKDFETGFWETEVSVGRTRYPRSSIFLNHWLIARTGEEVVAREVFARFKTYSSFESGLPMDALVKQIHSAAGVYRKFVESASASTDAIDRLALFGYRTGVLESEVIKPFVLYLFDPEQAPIASEQVLKALEAVESWMVRRMLVRATTKSYSQVVAELITALTKADRAKTGEAVEEFLSSQASESRYWPDDQEVRDELRTLPAYRRLGRGRLRMVLEAVEDHLRGWRNGNAGLGGQRVARGVYAIEHILPRKWATHWPLPEGLRDVDRDQLVHTFGNLTLLTSKLNSKVSNSAWLGTGCKRHALEEHDVLLLNRRLLDKAGNAWNEEAIKARTQELTDIIVQIWRVPPGHRSRAAHHGHTRRRKLSLQDLIAAGLLEPGMRLEPRRSKYAGKFATLLSDGRLDVDGVAYDRPVQAATSIVGKRTGGWWFFVDPTSGRSLRAIRRDYINAMAVDADEDEADEDDEDEG